MKNIRERDKRYDGGLEADFGKRMMACYFSHDDLVYDFVRILADIPLIRIGWGNFRSVRDLMSEQEGFDF